MSKIKIHAMAIALFIISGCAATPGGSFKPLLLEYKLPSGSGNISLSIQTDTLNALMSRCNVRATYTNTTGEAKNLIASVFLVHKTTKNTYGEKILAFPTTLPNASSKAYAGFTGQLIDCTKFDYYIRG